MAKGDFFSPNRKTSSKDKQVASSMSSGSYGGYVDAGSSRGFVSPEQAESMLANPERFKMRPSETRYLRESMGLPRAQFFSPSGNEVGQIASATSDLSGLIARDTSDEAKFKNYMNLHGLEKNIKSYPPTMIRMMKQNMQDDEAEGRFKDGQFVNQLPKNYGEQEQKVIQDNQFNNYLNKQFGTDDLNYGDKQFLRESFNEGNPYQRFNFDQSLKKPTTDTKIAMGDNLGGYAAAIGGLGSMAIMGANAIKNTIQNLAPKFKKDIDKRINPEANRVSIGDQVGGFLNRMMGISPVAAGTLDANQQVSQVSERPKLGYVNPDAKTMSLSEIGEAFKPRNLFGYKDKFGRFDDPGSPLARDRAETMQRVAQNFNAPITPDARTIGQIRADQEARMRENARLRNESFQRGERVQQKSADVTYGTNMLSNPAFGFRDKMTDAAKAQYDRSAKDATEMARTDPSLGNVAMQTFNRISGLVGGPQASLEKIGERQLRLANKEINRPTYQKEAYARKMLGITNEQLKARNLQRIRVNAAARNQAFQSDRRAKAVERVARRYGQNTGSGRTGGFGSGTVGKGMSSNPASQRQQGVGVSANNLSRHSVGHSSTQPGKKGSPSGKKGGPSGGGPSGKKGGPSGKKGGPSGGGPSGGSPSGKKGINRSKSRRRCDIRTKIDITSLTNQNLIKDDLATVAYFVQELRGN